MKVRSCYPWENSRTSWPELMDEPNIRQCSVECATGSVPKRGVISSCGDSCSVSFLGECYDNGDLSDYYYIQLTTPASGFYTITQKIIETGLIQALPLNEKIPQNLTESSITFSVDIPADIVHAELILSYEDYSGSISVSASTDCEGNNQISQAEQSGSEQYRTVNLLGCSGISGRTVYVQVVVSETLPQDPVHLYISALTESERLDATTTIPAWDSTSELLSFGEHRFYTIPIDLDFSSRVSLTRDDDSTVFEMVHSNSNPTPSDCSNENKICANGPPQSCTLQLSDCVEKLEAYVQVRNVHVPTGGYEIEHLVTEWYSGGTLDELTNGVATNVNGIIASFYNLSSVDFENSYGVLIHVHEKGGQLDYGELSLASGCNTATTFTSSNYLDIMRNGISCNPQLGDLHIHLEMISKTGDVDVLAKAIFPIAFPENQSEPIFMETSAEEPLVYEISPGSFSGYGYVDLSISQTVQRGAVPEMPFELYEEGSCDPISKEIGQSNQLITFGPYFFDASKTYYLQLWGNENVSAIVELAFRALEVLELESNFNVEFVIESGDDPVVYSFEAGSESIYLRAVTTLEFGTVEMHVYDPDLQIFTSGEFALSAGEAFFSVAKKTAAKPGKWWVVVNRISTDVSQAIRVTLGKDNCGEIVDFGQCEDVLALGDSLVFTEYDSQILNENYALFASFETDVKNVSSDCFEAAKTFFCAAQIPICDESGFPTKTLATCEMCDSFSDTCGSEAGCFDVDTCSLICGGSDGDADMSGSAKFLTWMSAFESSRVLQ
eukprot:TRINITY_DN14027_c0_g1_i1.p1 TRINITY_DN14027_c0_g1~~TRINITY_DN14027_c0_g1_i1.p1  ORF type:complete len:824 (+),score=139.07 TRINITY_DN14027_c0_g1_i1:130-2472(+)